MLNKLREVDLQIDIDKCEFKIQKISFLELLIFINDLRMNSRKVDVIRSWKVSRSLTHVQIFIDFCNFYQRFIKNFSKIVWFMIKLTWKDHFFEWTEICQTIFEELKQQVMMLRVCRDWIEFSSQQVLEVLAHVEPLASTLYSSAFDTRANLLRPLCFALL